MRPERQRSVLFAAWSERLRRGVCLPLFRTLNPPGPCTPRKTPRASRVWPGSNSCEAGNSRHSRNSMQPSGASPPRKAGNAKKAVLCRSWATGCAGNAGLIRCGLPNRRAKNALRTCGRQCRRRRNGNSVAMKRGLRTKHGCGHV